MKWLQDLIAPATRDWEEFYRNRWQHDKVVRSSWCELYGRVLLECICQRRDCDLGISGSRLSEN